MIYTDSSLDDLSAVVNRVSDDLMRHADKFDFIAVRGCSGIVVGAPVALAINKPLVIVRKEDESSHDYGKGRRLVNYRRAHGRYLFLDDFVAGGATRRAVKDTISECCPTDTEYAGSYLYQNEDFPFLWASAPLAKAA